MDGINPIFSDNIFVSYPSNFQSKQKTVTSLSCKDVFGQNDGNIDNEITRYLDILYEDTDEESLKKTDKLKLNSAYSPMKCQKLHYGGFYL